MWTVVLSVYYLDEFISSLKVELEQTVGMVPILPPVLQVTSFQNLL